MDVLDLTESEINNYINGRIQHAKVQQGPKLVPTGECHYCLKKLEPNDSFAIVIALKTTIERKH